MPYSSVPLCLYSVPSLWMEVCAHQENRYVRRYYGENEGYLHLSLYEFFRCSQHHFLLKTGIFRPLFFSRKMMYTIPTRMPAGTARVGNSGAGIVVGGSEQSNPWGFVARLSVTGYAWPAPINTVIIPRIANRRGIIHRFWFTTTFHPFL